MNFKFRIILLLVASIALTYEAISATYPQATGDIADNGATGWNGEMPDATGLAYFQQANGRYTAGGDVKFGAVSVGKNTTFDIEASRTVTLSSMYIANNNVSCLMNGGLWDFSVAAVPSSINTIPNRTLAACNQNAQSGTTLTLAGGCIATNITLLRIQYNSSGNTLKITDNSRVYAEKAQLFVRKGVDPCNGLLEVSSGGMLTLMGGNFQDTAAVRDVDLVQTDTMNKVLVTGNGSKISAGKNNYFVIGHAYGRNSLYVENGGELVVPYCFRLGASANANNNLAVFDSGAKATLNEVYLGVNGSFGNRLIVSNSTFSCSRIFLNAYSNSVSLVGAGTSFTTTINNLPRYPIVDSGAWNTFELDGVEWSRGFSIQTDFAASSNTIRFVNGAKVSLPEGGLFSGTNHIASCGNRVYIGGGSLLDCTFVNISRADNVLTVSNSTVVAASDEDRWSGIHFGQKLQNVDLANIGGNGLVIQGNTPSVSAVREIKFQNGSFLRFEMPEGTYAEGCVPVSARAFSISEDSALEIDCAFGRMSPGKYTLISTTNGITIPESVLEGANASLVEQGNSAARLALSNGGKTLLLKVSRGTVLSFR